MRLQGKRGRGRTAKLNALAVLGDNPIQEAGDDVLLRGSVAASFACQLLAVDASGGLVAGVLGPWGSGKTSFLNLARAELEDGAAALLDFNPWMFSGAEQLVDSFFIELSSELKLRTGLAEIGEDLADYGEAFAGLGWLPVVGSWIDRGRGTAKILGKYLSRRREGTHGRREKLTTALRKLQQPIVVILDDVDRLSSPEIRDVFKLIRLTASFPNIIYIVAFDRTRVEQALTEERVPGRDYLEKILQVAIDLPVVPQEVMIREVTGALDQALSGNSVGEIDGEVWPDVLMEIIRPLIGNMRDVRRYAAAVHATVDTLGDQIALADLLAMEAIRVFLPDVYAHIQISVAGLCTPSEALGGGGRYEPPQRKKSIEQMLKIAGDQEDVVRALLRRLFPFSRRHFENNNYGPDWLHSFLRERRIAHEAILGLYLERVAGRQLVNFTYAEQAWLWMDDEAALDRHLRSVPPERQEDVIAALQTYESEYKPEHVIAATPVLLNLMGDLPDRLRGMFDVDSRLVVGRVAYRLLRTLDGHEVAAQAVGQIMPKLTSLSAKFQLLTTVGYREGAGHELVSADDARLFEESWREEVRSAEAGDLVDEDDLLRVFYWARADSGPDEVPVDIPADPSVTRAVLRSARSETRSQTDGNRAVRRESVLAWSTLEEVYGDEATLTARIEAMKSSPIDLEEDLAELIDKYLGGWRPRDFGEDEDDE